jgi:hypothetical protein
LKITKPEHHLAFTQDFAMMLVVLHRGALGKLGKH